MDSSQPFSEPFEISARDSAIWITPSGTLGANSSTRLHIRGTSWSGLQEDGCVHQLYKHSVQQYLDFLSTHDFNAVRLPLSATLINANPILPAGTCGEYAGWRLLAALDDLLLRLQRIGVFVVLGMHTISGGNSGYWCGELLLSLPPSCYSAEPPFRCCAIGAATSGRAMRRTRRRYARHGRNYRRLTATSPM